jgi:glycerol uptake facilitator-like aquaporin
MYSGVNPALLPVPRRWTYRWMRYFAEFIGALMIAFIVTATNAQLITFLNARTLSPSPAGFMLVLEVVMAQVFIYAITYAIFRTVSGAHFNPAITLGYMLLFEIGWLMGCVYVMFQLAGAIIGALMAYGVHWQSLLAGPMLDPMDLCLHNLECPQLPGDGRGFAIELIGSSAIIFTFFMVDLGRVVGDLAFLVIGFVYGAFFLALKVFVTAFFNPAVALGAACASLRYDWRFNNFWLFIIAPLVGSFVAAFFYGVFFQIEGHGTGPHLRPWSKRQRPIRFFDPYEV